MVRNREPQRVIEKKDLQTIEDKFINGTGKIVLKDLSLDELAEQFESIGRQAQLFQGRILLEARRRFESDKLFGEWCATRPLCLGSQSHRTRLINLAEFFENRKLEGISLTAAYEISAPKNIDVAEKVYEYAVDKNLSVDEIKTQIEIEKKHLSSSGEIDKNTNSNVELMPLADYSAFKERVFLELASLEKKEMLRVLKECVNDIQSGAYQYPSEQFDSETEHAN